VQDPGWLCQKSIEQNGGGEGVTVVTLLGAARGSSLKDVILQCEKIGGKRRLTEERAHDSRKFMDQSDTRDTHLRSVEGGLVRRNICVFRSKYCERKHTKQKAFTVEHYDD
jgi:hypothetical protein